MLKQRASKNNYPNVEVRAFFSDKLPCLQTNRTRNVTVDAEIQVLQEGVGFVAPATPLHSMLSLVVKVKQQKAEVAHAHAV